MCKLANNLKDRNMRNRIIAVILLLSYNSFSQKSELLNNEAVDLFNNNQIDSALTKLDEAQKEDSTFFGTFYNRAVIYRELGKNDLAIEQFSKSIRLNQNDTNSYMNRGILYSKNQNIEKALKDYNSVLKIDPNKKEAHINIGLIYFNSGNLKDAESKFLKCVQIDPKYDPALFRLAKICLQNEKFDEAYDYLNKSIALNNNEFEYYEIRGVMNLMKGDKIKACEDLERAINLGSKDLLTLKFQSEECK
jgi:tetratricopeptide (TPR) repeat protein